MISLRLRIFIIILLVLVLAFIINMVRKRALELKYVLAWLLCDFALLIFTCFPKTMTIIKNFHLLPWLFQEVLKIMMEFMKLIL